MGGPIATNKLFFFAAYQGTKVRQDPSDRTSFVPTAAMLAGDFTAFASPACNAGRQITLRVPFVGNRIDPVLFSKPAVTLAGKLPSTSDPCGRIVYTFPTLENDYMAIGRIDFQRSANHSVFGRYLIDSAYIPPPYDLNKNLLAASGNGADGLSQAFTIGDTYLFNSNIVNSLRLSANRFSTNKTVPDLSAAHVGPPEIGIKKFSYLPHDPPGVSITGGFSISLANGPTALATFGRSDDLSVVRGNHQLAFGGQMAM